MSIPRHQCLIYKGLPSQNLPALAATIQRKLKENCRCLYLNSPVMTAGMGSCLAAIGVDVCDETERKNPMLSSDQSHLVNGQFDVDRMVDTLEQAVQRALSDGHAGLWATGDMTWEFGSQRNLAKLVDYERRLEELFQKYPILGGICQYHADTLPREILQQGLQTHPSIFVNETLSYINTHYIHPGLDGVASNPSQIARG